MQNIVVGSSSQSSIHSFKKLAFQVHDSNTQTKSISDATSMFSNLDQSDESKNRFVPTAFKMKTSNTGLLVALDAAVSFSYPVSLNLGYFSMTMQLPDGKTEIARIDMKDLLLNQSIKSLSLALDIALGRGEVLARGMEKIYRDYQSKTNSNIYVHDIRFGSSSTESIDILRQIKFNGLI